MSYLDPHRTVLLQPSVTGFIRIGLYVDIFSELYVTLGLKSNCRPKGLLISYFPVPDKLILCPASTSKLPLELTLG